MLTATVLQTLNHALNLNGRLVCQAALQLRPFSGTKVLVSEFRALKTFLDLGFRQSDHSLDPLTFFRLCMNT